MKLYSLNMFLTSVVGLASHMKSIDSKLSKSRFTKVIQQQAIFNTCQFCDKVFGFTAGLKGHVEVHASNVNGKDS